MKPRRCCLLQVLAFLVATSALGRSPDPPAGGQVATMYTPAYCRTAHNVGKIVLAVGNDGRLGNSGSGYVVDCFTGAYLPACEYPVGSNSVYLWEASLWLGSVLGDDTVVSTGIHWFPGDREFHPGPSPEGDMIYRSTLNPTSLAFEGAVSEQDFVARYTDTCMDCPGVGYDQWDNRPYRPLGIEITQYSYAWSHPHTEDFVLFDYILRNLGDEPISELFVGLQVDGDVHYDDLSYYEGATDDITGFLATVSNPFLPIDCGAGFETRLAWTADNDGDLIHPTYSSVPHVTGVRFLGQLPVQSLVSYNWWQNDPYGGVDFGPQTRLNYRIFPTGGSGNPLGDRARYFVLSNGEIDYDQFRTGTIGSTDSIWPPPPLAAPFIAQGIDTRYLLSLGPFDIGPGEELSVPIAYVAGEDLHTDPSNINNLPDDPDTFEASLDFSDLTINAIRAEWVYDNPGIDTDGDGYFGEYRLCGEDTIWIRGDGVPDWRPSSAPKAAALWVEPRPHALWVRWNGFEHETALDPVSRTCEFEGYRAYLSTTGTPGSYACLASYDIEDYVRSVWDTAAADWIALPERWTPEAGRCMYAPGGCDDPDWHPLDYPRQQPFVMPDHPDSVFYFEPLGVNAWRFGLETPFVKRFPDAIRSPYATPTDVPADSIDFYLTADGYFKYYEYEYLIDNLLSLQSYWVVVTAFDHGSAATGSPVMESGLAPEALVARPLPDPENCCEGLVGNVDCDPSGDVDIADVAQLIHHLYIDQGPLCCPAEADINRSGGEAPGSETITIGDVALLIDHLFINQQPLPECL